MYVKERHFLEKKVHFATLSKRNGGFEKCHFLGKLNVAQIKKMEHIGVVLEIQMHVYQQFIKNYFKFW